MVGNALRSMAVYLYSFFGETLPVENGEVGGVGLAGEGQRAAEEAARIVTYWQEKKKTSHAAIGKKGRKNWRVMGSSSDSINSVATVVLTMGPGDWMTQRAKMPTMARKRYWAS